MIKVVYVTGEPTPYRTPHLNALAARPELDLQIVYAARTIQQRTWATHESGRVTYLEGPSLPLSRLLHHDYPLTTGIWPLLERTRPDCVIVGGWSLLATQLATVWCRTRRVPYLLQSDNHLREPRTAWVRGVKRMVLPRLVPQAAGWLVPGSLAREHILAYGADPARVIRFPLTVDVAAVSVRVEELKLRRPELRAQLRIPESSAAVLQVARLIKEKGTNVLLQAVAAVGTPHHLVVVGDGPEKHDLRALAERLRVPATFTGHLEDDDLLGAYAAADVFTLLSRREAWGVVVNEAAAAGLPLVLSDQVGAAADLLVPGRNGILVPAGDDRAATAALRQIAGDSALRRRMGDESRALVAEWGYENSIEDLLALLGEVTGRAATSADRR